MIILGGKGEGHTAAETVPKRKSPVLGRPLGSHTCAEAAPCVRHGPRIRCFRTVWGHSRRNPFSLVTRDARRPAGPWPSRSAAGFELCGRVEHPSVWRPVHAAAAVRLPLRQRVPCPLFPISEHLSPVTGSVPLGVLGIRKSGTLRRPREKGKAPRGEMEGHLGRPADEPRAFALLAETTSTSETLHLFQKWRACVLFWTRIYKENIHLSNR